MARNASVWIYRLEDDHRWNCGARFDREFRFADRNGRVWLTISPDGTLTIARGYAWDGCTPKVVLLDLVFGTPDGAVNRATGRSKTYFASLIHDVLYQFLDQIEEAGLAITRRTADEWFLRLMEIDGFLLRRIYFHAVRIFGQIARGIEHRIRGMQGKVL